MWRLPDGFIALVSLIAAFFCIHTQTISIFLFFFLNKAGYKEIRLYNVFMSASPTVTRTPERTLTCLAVMETCLQGVVVSTWWEKGRKNRKICGKVL